MNNKKHDIFFLTHTDSLEVEQITGHMISLCVIDISGSGGTTLTINIVITNFKKSAPSGGGVMRNGKRVQAAYASAMFKVI